MYIGLLSEALRLSMLPSKSIWCSSGDGDEGDDDEEDDGDGDDENGGDGLIWQ